MEQDKGPKPDVSASQSRFYAFFSNPWVGIVGTAASIVGVFLAVYFYLQSVSHPELVYFVNPVRTIVVKQGTASRLGVVFDGHPLTQDITASQVALWNRGHQAIRRASILQAVTIATEPSVPILEATIRKTSRDVVGFDVDRTHLAEGEVSVSWNILEEGDGGVVQLVYAGDVGTQLRCRGVIEGQRDIGELKFPPGTILSPELQMWIGIWARYLLVPLALILLIIAALDWKGGFRRFHRPRWVVNILISPVLPIALAVACLLFFLLEGAPAPPFGF